MSWTNIGVSRNWKGWEYESQQTSLNDFFEEEDNGNVS